MQNLELLKNIKNMKKNTKEKILSILSNRIASYTLGGTLLLLIFAYVYVANSTVHTVTALQKVKTEIQTLSVSVSEMESERLTLENGINSEKAVLLGLVEVQNPRFIFKSKNPISLSLNSY